LVDDPISCVKLHHKSSAWRTLRLLRMLGHAIGVGSAALFVTCCLRGEWFWFVLCWNLMLIVAAWERFLSTKMQSATAGTAAVIQPRKRS